MSSGPIIVINSELIDNSSFTNLVNKLVSKNDLSKADGVIIRAFLFAAQYESEHETDSKSYIRFFSVMDKLSEQENPDRPGKLFKFGKASRYNKLKYYESIGFLKKLQKEDVVDELKKQKNGTSIFQLQRPTELFTTKKTQQVTEKVNTAEYRQKIIEEKMALAQSTNLHHVTSRELRKVGTHVLLSKFLSRATKPDKTFEGKTLKTEFLVPSTLPTEKHAKITITSTSLSTTELVGLEEMLLVEYSLSRIKQYILDNQDHLPVPIKNAFSLDIVDIIKDFNKEDSGGYREIIYNTFVTISGTEFDISASEGAKKLMQQFGFVDEHGNIYDAKKVSILKIDGERLESDNSERKQPRYITVKLPDFMIDSINDYLNNKTLEVLPMFNRNEHQLTAEYAGYCWTLNNYLMSMLAKENFTHGPIDVDKFILNFLPSLKELDFSTIPRQRLFTALSVKSRILYKENFNKNVRRQISFSMVICQLEEFVILIENTTSIKSKLSSQKYRISIIRSDKDLKDLVAAQWLALDKSNEYYENSVFKEKVIDLFNLHTSRFLQVN